jgi:hypothetical protein
LHNKLKEYAQNGKVAHTQAEAANL